MDEFYQAVRGVLDEKLVYEPGLIDPLKLRPAAVLTEERLSQEVFPLCELLGFQTTYETPDQMVKQAAHRIGIRWTCCSDREDVVVASVEILCTATVELLWAPDFAGYMRHNTELNAGSVNVLEEDYSPLVPDANRAFLKSGLVIVEITTYRS